MSLRPLSTYPSLVASFFPFHPTTTTPFSQLFDATCTTMLGRLNLVPMFLVSVDLSWSRSMSRAQACPTFHVFLTISDRFRYTISARCYDVQCHGSVLSSRSPNPPFYIRLVFCTLRVPRVFTHQLPISPTLLFTFFPLQRSLLTNLALDTFLVVYLRYRPRMYQSLVFAVQ